MAITVYSLNSNDMSVLVTFLFLDNVHSAPTDSLVCGSNDAFVTVKANLWVTV
jgi:hypothetical protein